jgi:hypothetical protein
VGKLAGHLLFEHLAVIRFIQLYGHDHSPWLKFHLASNGIAELVFADKLFPPPRVTEYLSMSGCGFSAIRNRDHRSILDRSRASQRIERQIFDTAHRTTRMRRAARNAGFPTL